MSDRSRKPERAEAPNFEGHAGRECGEHRTTGSRAWCFDCSEWCYPSMPCKGCERPTLLDAFRYIRAEARENTEQRGRTKAAMLVGFDNIILECDKRLANDEP